jgi:hypothetical protein
MRNFIISVMLAVFAFSCGDSVATKSKPKNDDDSSVSENDSDQTASDDENVNDDNQTTKDDEVVKDDISVPDEDSVISDTCGNTSIEWTEVCDGGTMDCVDIDDTKYSSGKAKCKDNCSGWDTATCVEIEPENCMNGDRRCYGAYQYQICAGGVWGEPATCSKSGTCYGDGLCSNDCYPHGSYSCYNGQVYWYDTCGEMEEIKENCGTSGYVGSKYCIDDEVYQDYKTVYCDYQSCDSETESVYIEYCDNGCVSGECNVEALNPPTNVAASDGSYDGYVYITWSAVTGATDYYIYRATSSTGTYSKIDSSGGYNYYYDYPPSANTSYYYKVSAYNSTAGESAMSSYNAGWCY